VQAPLLQLPEQQSLLVRQTAPRLAHRHVPLLQLPEQQSLLLRQLVPGLAQTQVPLLQLLEQQSLLLWQIEPGLAQAQVPLVQVLEQQSLLLWQDAPPLPQTQTLLLQRPEQQSLFCWQLLPFRPQAQTLLLQLPEQHALFWEQVVPFFAHLQLPPLQRPEQQFLSFWQLAPVRPHPATSGCASTARVTTNANGPAARLATTPLRACRREVPWSDRVQASNRSPAMVQSPCGHEARGGGRDRPAPDRSLPETGSGCHRRLEALSRADDADARRLWRSMPAEADHPIPGRFHPTALRLGASGQPGRARRRRPPDVGRTPAPWPPPAVTPDRQNGPDRRCRR
jgi:hypothetical protein